MGANATGVSARVKSSPDTNQSADRVRGRLAGFANRQVILVTVALTLLGSGLAVTLWSDHLASRDAALESASARLDLVASLAAHEIRLIAGDDAPTADQCDALARSLPPGALSRGRVAYLSDTSGFIVAAAPATSRHPKSLADLFGEGELAGFGEDGGIASATLRDGTPVIATIRALAAGHLAVVEPRPSAAAGLTSPGYGQPALALVLAAGLVGLGAGCLRYRQRARLAHLTCARLTSRLDTSLIRGRCGLFDWDLAKDRVFWSTSMYELLGYEPRDEYLLAGEVAAVLHPEQGCLQALIAGIADSCGEAKCDHDLRARTAAGQWLWLRTKAEVVNDPVDGSRHIVGFAIDVTDERGQAEQRAMADIRLRDAVEAISEAFVLWDADRRLVLCNSKFLKLYELPPERASPGTPAERVLAAGRRPILEKLLISTHPRDPGARTIETQLSDGRWLHVNERRTKDGGMVSVGTDVTALKRSEAKLRERERHLQGSVREAETEKQRLAIVAERNIEANQAKTEFLARMSHELRTPLNAIIGFADMMRNEVLGPLGTRRYSEYTRDIHASGLKLLDVIDGILQMSRIERGQVQLAPQLMTIGSAVERALAALAPEAQAKGSRIEIDILEPALFQADGDAVHEVLIQLLRNGIKFTPPGGSMRIRVRPANERLNIFIEDTGIGIPSDVLPRLGRPFEQVEAEYSRAGGGSGLGLAIAGALTELHGGRLKIRSRLGVGTIVLVALPVVQPAANDLRTEEEAFHSSCMLLVAAE